MSDIEFTPEQQRAIETVGRSLIVTAAAGSGKTAVLAARCAYLVCDAPPEARCDVDRLLVLTFTEAAAAQMRARIVQALRDRADERPTDARLRQQTAIVDAAHISTVHAFCLWVVRRWFTQAGVDPVATVLDEDEAELLRRDVLEALFLSLYAAAQDESAEPLGAFDPPVKQAVASQTEEGDAAGKSAVDAELAHGFVRLVDDYGLGDDRSITAVVLRLHEFVNSLPDSDGWLDAACDVPANRPEEVLLRTADALRTELELQIEHCTELAETLEAGDAVGHFHAAKTHEYVGLLTTWLDTLGNPEAPARDRMKHFDHVRQALGDYAFDRSRAPNLAKDADPVRRAARQAAADQYNKQVKGKLFKERLHKVFGLFTVDEWIDGLRLTAPFIATICSLTRAFGAAYARRKRELNVMDFADLERFALAVLCDSADPRRPSDIAASLQRRFAHMLVDEFQDINPLQEAIIRLVCRESDSGQVDNLFVVGDVKQSIYRFRLAEPTIFTKRLTRFRESDAKKVGDGEAIPLQKNFRSRAEILDAVNFVFRRLMSDKIGEVVYDDEAELRVGRAFGDSPAHQPVEVHLLERHWTGGGADEDGEEGSDEPTDDLASAASDLNDPARWSVTEREAFLIGLRIKAWRESGTPLVEGRVPEYRDVVVLLRAKRINAERMAGVLNAMAIPAHADVGGSLLAAREVRDVLAALRCLDNVQQDIPLASVLRSGVFADPFSEDQLVEIRCLDRDAPFHEAIRRYAKEGADRSLRARVALLFETIERYRIEVHRRPLPDALWRIYQEEGYLAYASGLLNGAQRRANLLKLHELARRFGTFRRQGLHRFLRFVESLADRKRDIAVAPAIAEADDVVRIMSIHQAKGLEFPVVFLAGLGNQFNLGDRHGRMIFERDVGIGLRVVDTERMIEYPTALHRQVAARIENSTREEEMRVLYVAMTRARDKLVLVGSQRHVAAHRHAAEGAASERLPTRLSITTARTPLDWLVPALRGASAGVVAGLGKESGNQPVFDVHLHEVDEMSTWRVGETNEDEHRPVRAAVARCEALPDGEPLAPDDPEVEQVLGRLEYVYPHTVSASVSASMAASEFVGTHDYTRYPEQKDDHRRGDAFAVPASKYVTGERDGPVGSGVLTHRVLQHLDFHRACDANGLALELRRMARDGVVTHAELETIDRESLAWFVTTPLADEIRRLGGDYRREFSFVAAGPLSLIDAAASDSPDDHVLVRGIVDGILAGNDALAIVDFKTDRVAVSEVAVRAEVYRPQLQMYALAVSRLWRRPIDRCWLVFLAPRVCHALRGV